ncbi:ABC transporter ATP-binding protein [candidate division KSB1 bacterium]|nr:MAG: ABC transporter ATP-binding protein [candidate division KSB1 bacterium]
MNVAVDSLSLEIHAGEIFGLIGPDGAGKTTTMRIAAALMFPDSGRVEVLGYNVVAEPMKVKEHIGYMPQRFSLYPDLTVAENLRFFADLYSVPNSERIAREERLMQFSRLEPFKNRRAAQLSGGMKQKLALSCTLIHTPDLLILDEPTTGVDPLSRQEFWGILKELAASGQALFVSTPYMDEALLCSRVALMHHGRALAAGTPQEITKQFQHNLLEIVAADVPAVRKKLYACGPAGIQVNRFGDRLHVIYDTEQQEREIRSCLSQDATEIRAMEPTIEDTFVSLMTAESAA